MVGCMSHLIYVSLVLAVSIILVIAFYPMHTKERLARGEKAANISTFGGKGDDNDLGIIGVDLKKWNQGQNRIRFKNKTVFPVAVHQKDGPGYLYKVLEIKANNLPVFYGLVVDVCNPDDEDCSNATRNGLNFLIDIHKSAWPALGMSESQGQQYLSTGSFKVVGKIPVKTIPRNLWHKDILSGSKYMLCSWGKWRNLNNCT